MRPLTQNDCASGFHRYHSVEKNEKRHVEKCHICNKVIVTDGKYKDSQNDKIQWAKDHKLDILQPMGADIKDFQKYYGQQ